ncbi:hypothetical protein GCM10010420_21570 [Streptomyces glaucosporus]|uniref:Uncharacterized protein n=1 Tax=Streptomyces glaucosporus TaxID=284044 RepID=A0ABN3I637_9ACTN
MVAAETVQLACPGVTPKSAVRAGSRGWVAYSRLKVARPTAKRARLMRRFGGTERSEKAPARAGAPVSTEGMSRTYDHPF